ncbi:lysylphosphatidylglycerol synthase transmembrane domain-containing protein [Alkalitalea saponilacus]|uniref:Lysylphosphatidylglycerol synthase TM region n=1 Tax=Alkalitalea saponilacus TaxID=889453 RepID=A0A1T5HT86_9BACT|nr:lysylphosphatidylglycerol synthase domain-containing protein [Alkalitalea saponilacus]ASB48947.1 hypothetical protein CDL62_07265 [Alkalitalea saponilacus]SKC23908.1 Lysylphosphatidylglycerol synthase TM region [Alkalitalea saponilacus]
MNDQKNQSVIRFARLIITVVSLAYVFYRIYNFQKWDEFLQHLSDNRALFYLLLIVQFLMLAINISFEGAKWKYLLTPVRIQNFKSSVIQVLKGLQLGVITPARIGEPVARALMLPQGSRVKAFLLSSAGSILQNIVLGFSGIGGMVYLASTSDFNSTLLSVLKEQIIFYVGIFFAAMLIVLGVLFRIISSKKNKRYLKKAAQHIVVLQQLTIKNILIVTGFTVLRYLVYTSQLWLMLWFFDISIHPSDLNLIFIYFATITFIPAIAIADIGIRGSVALFLFGMISANHEAIMVSVFILWVINVGTPVIIASFLKSPEKAKSLPINQT